jgi:hypothetical protein
MAITILRDPKGAAERSTPLNQSTYDYDLTKLHDAPVGLEEIDGYRTNYKTSDHSVTRYYQIPWGECYHFEQWVLGYSYTEIVASPGDPTQQAFLRDVTNWFGNVLGVTPTPAPVEFKTYKLRRVLPLQDPVRYWLFASSCELIENDGAWVEDPENFNLYPHNNNPVINPITGKTDRISAIRYVSNDQGGTVGQKSNPGPEDVFSEGMAKYRVTFTPRLYEVRSDDDLASLSPGTAQTELNRFVTRKEQFAIEAVPLAKIAAGQGDFTTLPPLQFITTTWKAKNGISATIPEAGVRQLPTAQLTYIWHDVPDLPRTGFAQCVGRVNKADFDGVGGAPIYPAGTLLCQPWTTERSVNVCGRPTHQITYRFLFRPQGWNFFLAADGNFYEASFGGLVGAKQVYDSADFSLLFQVPPPVTYLYPPDGN